MSAKQILPGLFELAVGNVNLFLFESEQGWVLIDAGFPNSAEQVLAECRNIVEPVTQIRHLIITHAHPDHIGSLAALKQATQAITYIHPVDAPIARAGSGFRPLTPAPGLLTGLLFRLFIRPAPPIEGTVIDCEINEGDVLPIAGGLTVLHTPGHSSGHISLWWPLRKVLFVGDACGNLPSLGWSLGYETLEIGRQSLQRLAGLEFEVACFGHGKSIVQGADQLFRKRWL